MFIIVQFWGKLICKLCHVTLLWLLIGFDRTFHITYVVVHNLYIEASVAMELCTH